LQAANEHNGRSTEISIANHDLNKQQHLKIKIMKASINKTATESKTGQYFSSFANSKRAQWAQYRNFNR